MTAATNCLTVVPSPFVGSRNRRAATRAPRARGAGAAPASAEPVSVLPFLNAALATKLVGVLRYRRHHFMARSLGAQRVAEEFLIHGDEQLAHADLLAERIVQLGGEPDFAPQTLGDRSPGDYAAGDDLAQMLRVNLTVAQRAIDGYAGQIEQLGESDPTRRMLEGILGVQRAHAEELADLLGDRAIA